MLSARTSYSPAAIARMSYSAYVIFLCHILRIEFRSCILRVCQIPLIACLSYFPAECERTAHTRHARNPDAEAVQRRSRVRHIFLPHVLIVSAPHTPAIRVHDLCESRKIDKYILLDTIALRCGVASAVLSVALAYTAGRDGRNISLIFLACRATRIGDSSGAFCLVQLAQSDGQPYSLVQSYNVV